MSLIQVDWTPSEPKLRQFALVWLSALSVLALVTAWKSGCLAQDNGCVLPSILAASAIGVGGLGLLRPRWIKPIYLAWMGLAFPIGLVISYFLLAVIYYVLITTLGLLLKAAGRDPLQKKLDRQADSYWNRHEPPGKLRRYFQQF